MRHKACISAAFLAMLTFLFWLGGLSTKNAIGKLADPEVSVFPSEAQVGQQVLVQAQINVETC